MTAMKIYVDFPQTRPSNAVMIPRKSRIFSDLGTDLIYPPFSFILI